MKKYLLLALLLIQLNVFAQENPEIEFVRNTKGLLSFRLSLVNAGTVNIDWGDGKLQPYKVNEASKIADATNISETVKRNVRIKIYGSGIRLFSCNDQFITEIDVQNANSLTTFECTKNYIKLVDLSNNKSLRTINVSANRLKNLNVNQNKKLVSLNCAYNYLSDIDISKNTALQYLNVSDNNMKDIDLSQHKALRNLSISGNKIKKLNVKPFTELKTLDITYCKFSACDLNRIFDNLPARPLEEKADRKNLLITQNKGVVGSNPNIAKNKGWSLDVEGKGSVACP
ncbi:leucine-rich repeat domain-containing protein [Pseudopedobacter beijingensis]|uniref:Leucine-rich repeat domain-containing protein n=1 Tax=Pseudopedobacter beijingensis TaxID=1207056 RepID=A0ABW4IFP7_9SPHI